MDQRTYVVKPMLPRLILAASLVAIMAFGGVRAFARRFGYLGAFFVTQSRTELGLFSNDLPLGARFNLEEDLGLRDSFAVPRMTVGWRFGQRHILSGSYYDLSRDAGGLVGGLAAYDATTAHGPFVHIDLRGYRARWGR